jgi:ABC-type amino acid transport substrate-binding protein
VAKGIDTVPAPELAATIRAMKLGRAKAVIYDSSILSYYLNQSGNTSLQLGPRLRRTGSPISCGKIRAFTASGDPS